MPEQNSDPRLPNYQQIYYSPSGQPYYMNAAGKKTYISPLQAAQMFNDPRAVAWAKSQGAEINPQTYDTTDTSRPKESYLKTSGTWNPETGKWDRGINLNNLLATGVGAEIGGAALGGIGSSAPAAQTTSVIPGTGIPVTSGVTAPGLAAPTGAIPNLAASLPTNPSVYGATPGAGILNKALGGSGVLKNILGAIPSALAGYSAIKNLTQGPPAANEELKRILALAEGRIKQTDPLFQQLNTMAQAQMPTYTKGTR